MIILLIQFNVLSVEPIILIYFFTLQLIDDSLLFLKTFEQILVFPTN